MTSKNKKIILRKKIEKKLSELSKSVDRQLTSIESFKRIKLQQFLDKFANSFELEELRQKNRTLFDYKTAKTIYPEEVPLDDKTKDTLLKFTLESKPMELIDIGKDFVVVVFENQIDKESEIMIIELSDEIQILISE